MEGRAAAAAFDVSAAGSMLIPGKRQEQAVCARAQRKDSETQTGNGRQSLFLLTGTQQRA